jgi:hypothetical protein
MGLRDKLRQASDRLRRLRLSLGPDSYFQYKRRRKYERTEADRARERAKDSAERERGEAGRRREYEERYRRERGDDLAPERTELEDQMESDR